MSGFMRFVRYWLAGATMGALIGVSAYGQVGQSANQRTYVRPSTLTPRTDRLPQLAAVKPAESQRFGFVGLDAPSDAPLGKIAVGYQWALQPVDQSREIVVERHVVDTNGVEHVVMGSQAVTESVRPSGPVIAVSRSLWAFWQSKLDLGVYAPFASIETLMAGPSYTYSLPGGDLGPVHFASLDLSLFADFPLKGGGDTIGKVASAGFVVGIAF